MKPFYYKGILISYDIEHMNYSKVIDAINELVFLIRHEKSVDSLSNEKQFDICIPLKLNDELTLITSINEKDEFFSVLNEHTQAFEDINFNEFIRIVKPRMRWFAKNVNKFCAAIERGEISSHYNSLTDNIKQLWFTRKEYIEKIVFAQTMAKTDDPEVVDVYRKTNEMNLINGYKTPINTPTELDAALNKSRYVSRDDDFER